MIIDSFKAKNLFSFKDIDVNLSNRGLVLVTGWNNDDKTSNACGKTNLASKGIIWTLYGKTVSGLRGDDVCRKGIDEDCWGQIILSKPEKLRVTRYRSPAKLVLEQYKNDTWVDISSRVQTETQERLDHLLGKDFQAFSHTDFFGQGLSNTFMHMSSLQQNNLFELVISLDKVNVLIEKVKDKKLVLVEKTGKLDSTIANLGGAIKEIDRQITSNQEQVKKIDRAKREMFIESDKVDIEQHIDKVNKDIEIARYEDYQINEKINLLKERVNKHKREQHTLVGQKKEIKQNLCPVCEQVINNDLYNKLLGEQEEINRQLKVLEPSIMDIEKELPIWNEKKLQVGKNQQILTNKLQKLSIIKEQSALLNTKELEQRKVKLEGELKNTREQLYQYQDDIQVLFFWEKAFKIDFRNFLIEKSCPFLETRTNKFLREMGQPQIKTQFSIDQELKSGDHKVKFNVSVKSDTGGDGFDSLSGGEQQFVSFAAGLAFSDLLSSVTSSESNIMILDEPFVCLDDANAEKLVTFIKDELTKIKSTILLVSNESSIRDLIPQRIEIQKENGISWIV